MSVEKIQKLTDSMEPQEAASAIGLVMKTLFPLLNEEVRLKFVMNLVGESTEDKVSSLVHL